MLGVPPDKEGVRGQKTVCVPKIGLKFPAPLIIFIFCRRKSFLMWVGGGSAGADQGPKHPPPLPSPPGSLSNSLIEAVCIC